MRGAIMSVTALVRAENESPITLEVFEPVDTMTAMIASIKRDARTLSNALMSQSPLSPLSPCPEPVEAPLSLEDGAV
jgi:hypothetical protein